MLEESVPARLHPVDGPHRTAHEELQPLGRTHIGEVCGELYCLGRTPRLEQVKSLRRKQWQREGVVN